MSANRRRSQSGVGYALRKLGLSAFVVSTFAAYAIHEHLIGADADLSPLPNDDASPIKQIAASPQIAPTLVPFPTNAVQALPTAIVPTDVPPTDIPAPTNQSAGEYVDGTYNGPSINAYYGYVQVQAVVQNGQLTDVQFIDFPQDRRTSQRINSRATPQLTQEAIQAQSGNVNIVTGATLTSQAFVESLSAALQSARTGI